MEKSSALWANARICINQQYAMMSSSDVVGSEHVKHLGVLLGYQMAAACKLTFSKIMHSIRAKISHWSTRGLSFLGRVHVAKQAIAASLWYHATFQSPPAGLIKQLASMLSRFVASAQLQLPVDDAASLAQGSAANPAELPGLASGGSLHPGRAASMLPYQAGGVEIAGYILVRPLFLRTFFNFFFEGRIFITQVQR